MRRDQVIGGYRIISDPTNDGGGKCVWAFAEKGGHEFFVKRFLEPKRPGSSGNELSRRLRLEECDQFERRHRAIMERLKPDMTGAGNLVLAVDFFCEGSTYYKVTERIRLTELKTPQSLSPRQKCVLLRTLALSLKLLHDINVVHGDLKPANVLVQRKTGAKSFFIAKLIDFDDSYISGEPPEREVVVGDSLFGAPEWRRYMQGDEGVKPESLTTAVDMFAFGLLVHHYLTGYLPGFDDRFGSPADAVNASAPLRIDERLSSSMRTLILDLTSHDPAHRPKVRDVLRALNTDACALHRKKRQRDRVPVKDTREKASDASRLRTNLRTENDGGSGPAPTSGDDGERPMSSRVRINLNGRDR